MNDRVRLEGEQTKVRLYGIDTPESSQPYGRQATDRLRELLEGGTGHVRSRGDDDRYGRKIADLVLPDGRVVNEILVAEGLAWHFKRYSDDVGLAEREQRARAEGLGLWAAEAPVPPWDWRKGRRSGSPATSDAPDPLIGARASVIANRRSRVFHEAHCPSFDLVSSRNRVPFPDVAAAAAAGYRRAGNCPAP